jgi:uncharacterized protein (DUF1330 family)
MTCDSLPYDVHIGTGNFDIQARNNAMQPAYLIVQLKIRNKDEYIQRYGLPLLEMLEKVGAEVLAVSPAPVVVEGEWSGNWTVVLKFPSMEAAQQWYESEECFRRRV